MKRFSVVLAFAVLFSTSVFLSAGSAAPGYTSTKTLQKFLPKVEGASVSSKDVLTKVQIGKNNFPMAMRMLRIGGQRIVVKIIDAHYEPIAYKDYYFYAEGIKEADPESDKFTSIKVNNQDVYIHQKVRDKSMKGITLVGNRYIVEVVANPSKDVEDIAAIMAGINFTRLANTNNPKKYRKGDYRIKRTAVVQEEEAGSKKEER